MHPSLRVLMQCHTSFCFVNCDPRVAMQVYPAALSNPRPCPPPALALLAAHRHNETVQGGVNKLRGLNCPAAGRYHMAQAGGGTVRGGKGAWLHMHAHPEHTVQQLLLTLHACLVVVTRMQMTTGVWITTFWAGC